MSSKLILYDKLRSLQKGYVAALYGQPYDVRRLDLATNVSVASNAPVISGLPARIDRITARALLEGAIFDSVAYEFEIDKTLLVLGDLLTETGYEAMPASYTFVQARPTRNVVMIRTEFAASITRPTPAGGASLQQPISGAIAAPGYLGVGRTIEYVLTLRNGVYDFAAPGAIPASVMCGLQPLSRVGEGTTPRLPTVLQRGRFVAYIPPMNIQLDRKDVLNLDGAGRYELMQQQVSLAGIVGTVAIAEKLGDSSG